MRAKIVTFLLFFLSFSIVVSAQEAKNQKKGKEKTYYVVIETEYGNMTVKLYNETPLHRDNFLKLVKEGFYDDLLFHRVIANFMIQGGDPNSRGASSDRMLGDGNLGYTIPAEFVDSLYHRKGALAAARTDNPEKASSSCQFYIVQGRVWNEQQLNAIAMQYGISFSPEKVKVYTTEGGTPFLDNNYTVFGQVVEGLEVVDSIAAVQTQRADRPAKDVKMKIKIKKK